METKEKSTIITVSTTVKAPIQKVWDFWTSPNHITQWNSASDEWHTPTAQNDLKAGGNFSYRMEAKDGSFGFDFGGIYNVVDENKFIEYTIADGRIVKISFASDGDVTKIVENFEAETTNSVELQQSGWQAILDKFKKYTEAN